jgi:hypothetical protein
VRENQVENCSADSPVDQFLYQSGLALRSDIFARARYCTGTKRSRSASAVDGALACLWAVVIGHQQPGQ